MNNNVNALRMSYRHILDEFGGILSAMPLAAFFGISATVFERFIGIEPFAFIAWVMIFFLDFFTGVRAAKHRGQKIVSAKLPQTFIDLAVYSILIVSLNLLARSSGVVAIPGVTDFNWLIVIKWTIFHAVLITQFYSVLENLKDSGSKAAGAILPIVDSLLSSRLRGFWKAIRKDHPTPPKE